MVVLGGLVRMRQWTPGISTTEDATNTDGSSTKYVGFGVPARSDVPEGIQAESQVLKPGTTIIETPVRITTQGKNVYRNGIRGSRGHLRERL